MQDYKIVGTVEDLLDGRLDFRRRELLVLRFGDYRRVTALPNAPGRGNVTVGAGVGASTFFALRSEPV